MRNLRSQGDEKGGGKTDSKEARKGICFETGFLTKKTRGREMLYFWMSNPSFSKGGTSSKRGGGKNFES